jgi:hypothetical protein
MHAVTNPNDPATIARLAELPIGTLTPLATSVSTIEGEMTHLVTLAVGQYGRAVNPEHQVEGRTGVWYAGPSRFVCDGRRYEGRTPVEHHGLWQDGERARRFAVSMGESARHREVPEYLYVPGFGVVA